MPDKSQAKSTSPLSWLAGFVVLGALATGGYIVYQNMQAGRGPFEFKPAVTVNQTDTELERLEAELARVRAERQRQEALAAAQPRSATPAAPIAPPTPPAAPVLPVPPIAQATPPVSAPPVPAAPSVPPAAPVSHIGALNGAWYSEQWKYGYVLNNGVGTATSTNSPHFAVGQKIIFLSALSATEFAGEQVYTDGKFYKVRVTLQPDGRLFFQGEKNVNWYMDRQGGQGRSSSEGPASNRSLTVLQDQARAFVRNYFGYWTVDDQRAMDFVRGAYAEQVNFYGTNTAKSEIVKQKQAFVQRWPIRNYKERVSSVNLNCSAQLNRCEIDGIVDWEARSPARDARSSGAAQFALTVDFSFNPPKILAESGKVIERSN